MNFLLGIPEPAWLARSEFEGVDVFVSERRLGRRVALPRAITRWALDSGGFSELTQFNGWKTTAEQYAARVRRYVDEVGRLIWASPQDWMCEPHMIRKTGLSVVEHQRRTIDNGLELRELAPDLPWIYVVQGWEPADYFRHVEEYARRGVDLTRESLVGIGSVCRREAMPVAGVIFRGLAEMGLSVHGFGLKKRGVEQNAHVLTSSDSQAWSRRARWADPLPGCRHRNCNYCPRFALQWRAQLLDRLAQSQFARAA